MKNNLSVLNYNQEGLIPAIVQDKITKQVLMMAWMNSEALALTREYQEAYFWSRSRQEIWHKGETSGNRMVVDNIFVDCDADTLLLSVEALGPACHTGHTTCFYRNMENTDV